MRYLFDRVADNNQECFIWTLNEFKLDVSYQDYLWNEIAGILGEFGSADATFELPPIQFPAAPPPQLVEVSDDGKSAATVHLVGGRGLVQDRILARLQLAGKAPATVYARTVTVSGSDLQLTFPTLKGVWDAPPAPSTAQSIAACNELKSNTTQANLEELKQWVQSGSLEQPAEKVKANSELSNIYAAATACSAPPLDDAILTIIAKAPAKYGIYKASKEGCAKLIKQTRGLLGDQPIPIDWDLGLKTFVETAKLNAKACAGFADFYPKDSTPSIKNNALQVLAAGGDSEPFDAQLCLWQQPDTWLSPETVENSSNYFPRPDCPPDQAAEDDNGKSTDAIDKDTNDKDRAIDYGLHGALTATLYKEVKILPAPSAATFTFDTGVTAIEPAADHTGLIRASFTLPGGQPNSATVIEIKSVGGEITFANFTDLSGATAPPGLCGPTPFKNTVTGITLACANGVVTITKIATPPTPPGATAPTPPSAIDLYFRNLVDGEALQLTATAYADTAKKSQVGNATTKVITIKPPPQKPTAAGSPG